MVSASLLASLEPDAIREEDHPRYAAAMTALSDTAFAAYRGLVYETPGFKDFFRAMTPIAEIATLKIGSRPSSRTKSSAIEDRSEEHTSELQSLMRISYAVFCLKKKKKTIKTIASDKKHK